MPLLNGDHPDSAGLTQSDGYVSANGILRHDDVKAENIAIVDLKFLDLA